jgi:hypothetical protein
MRLFEEPLAILFGGAFLFAITFALWYQIHDRRALVAAFGTLALTASGLVVERLVVTDGEQVRRTLRRIVSQMEQNDRAAVLAEISDSATELREEAESVLSRVEIVKITIKRNLRVEVVRRGGRKSAEARFNAVATVEDRRGVFGRQIIPRFLIVRFRYESQQWKVTSYDAFDPRDGLRRRLGRTESPSRSSPG